MEQGIYCRKGQPLKWFYVKKSTKGIDGKYTYVHYIPWTKFKLSEETNQVSYKNRTKAIKTECFEEESFKHFGCLIFTGPINK